ncbi:hypothetical protein DMN91_000116 [Ooceraea biroi]|uniref:Uncharacterized protein n=1 Tax=Ooceraea biroi TaxID=2015173 RepID=A0A026WXU2_OOCBI|nr:hypothetical protein X777_14634 [Ooceraea biroi]RLU26322.1 hypothetical protein DMN91_000116 [Ooceraea biroi]
MENVILVAEEEIHDVCSKRGMWVAGSLGVIVGGKEETLRGTRAHAAGVRVMNVESARPPRDTHVTPIMTGYYVIPVQDPSPLFPMPRTGRRVAVDTGRGHFASVVRNLLGPIYGDGVMNLVIRQARDILVCAYHGNLDNFVRIYLSPAAGLLAEVKYAASETVSYFGI